MNDAKLGAIAGSVGSFSESATIPVKILISSRRCLKFNLTTKEKTGEELYSLPKIKIILVQHVKT